LPIEVKACGEAQLAAQGKILLDSPVNGTGTQAASQLSRMPCDFQSGNGKTPR
jgi:hypothetical protein